MKKKKKLILGPVLAHLSQIPPPPSLPSPPKKKNFASFTASSC